MNGQQSSRRRRDNLTQRRRDESMSLLVDIASSALDPGYAEVAARQAPSGEAGRGRAGGWPLLVIGLVASALLVVLALVQTQRTAPAAARSRASLLSAVQRQTNTVADLERQLAGLRAQTTKLRDADLASTSAGSALTRLLDSEELVAGSLPVAGPGLQVTVQDSAPTAAGQRNKVLDRDLQAVVNALWAAGAEAVAVNGQRITAQSAIRQAGEAILINFQPVASPYVVDAVGDPVKLATQFGASPTADRLRSYTQLYGLRFSYKRDGSLHLPPAAELTVTYARPTRVAAETGGPR
jgi:uncharacterized protein YlxW (UPF0749 family)